MSLSIHHIAIDAFDLEASSQLLSDLKFRDVVVEQDRRIVAAPNVYLMLHKVMQAPGDIEHKTRVCDPGIGHICIQSSPELLLWDKLSSRSLHFISKPQSLGGSILYAYGRDCEYRLFEVETIAEADPAADPWIGHVAIVTSDIDRLCDFYERLLGRPPHRRIDAQNPRFDIITGLSNVSVRAAWIAAGNLVVEMWQFTNPPTAASGPMRTGRPGYHCIGFASDDLIEEAERLASLGVGVEEQTAANGRRILRGRDPDGNLFIVTPTPGADDVLSFARLSDPHIVSRSIAAQS